MDITERIKAISYLKSHTDQKKLNDQRMSFLKLLALGSKEIADGKVVSEEEFLNDMHEDQ